MIFLCMCKFNNIVYKFNKIERVIFFILVFEMDKEINLNWINIILKN